MNFPAPVLTLMVLSVLSCAGCEGSGLFKPKPRAVPLDLSSPKQASLTYVKAIAQGDAVTARDASIGTEDQKKWIDAIAAMTGGLQRLDEALVHRFGNAAGAADTELKTALQPLALDPVAAVDASREDIDGDTARLVAPNTFAGRRMSHASLLRKDSKGLWKVDLPALFKAYPLLQQQNRSEIFKHYLTAGKALQSVAADIQKGKYKTPAEARDAINQRLDAQ